MSPNIQYIDWGLIDYKEAWDKQKFLFDELIEQKNRKEKDAAQWFIVCEHPHVYTLGRNGQANNLLINDELIQKIGATYYHIDRGGDITYHGPGQVVGYPILDLEQLNISLEEYVFRIEEAIIRTLAEYQVEAARMSKARGVWLDVGGKNPRKICAVGIRVRQQVTMHGFALNVNTDLSYFSHINPCGFTDKGVTSLSKELQRPIEMEAVKEKIYSYFYSLLNEITN